MNSTTLEKLKKLDIEFAEDGHTYTRKSDGKLLTGVTTILGVRNKPFLMWWTVKLMHEVLKDKQEAIKNATPEQYLAIIDEAKKAHTVKKKTSAETGHAGHAWIENYIKTGETEKPKDEKVISIARAFLKWEKTHKVKWLASELLVASDKYDFAGMLDGLALVDGKLTIVDFKTSNQVSEEYALQTAGYWIALAEMGMKADQRLILRLGKENSDFEAVIVPTDLDFDCRTFLNLREVHKWDVYINNNFRDENKKLKFN